MTKLVGSAVLAMAIGWMPVAAPVHAQSNEGGISSDVENEKQIRRLYADFTKAWNAHDVDTMTGMWAIDGDTMEPDGRHAQGRTAVGILLQREHETVFAKTTLDLSVNDVWFPAENVALVDGGYEITGIRTPYDKELPARRGHLTAVLIKENGRWWIAASRSSIPVTLPYRE